jgi:GNAT superfamily N-acetyltransferase
MPFRISEPLTDPEGLEELAPLWAELHRHHRAVSEHLALVEDLDSSWVRRLALYRRLLSLGASYLMARHDDGQLVGYALIAFEDGPDDTFEVRGGIAELVTLVVTRRHRSTGLGRALVRAAERVAADRGFDTMKIAVLSGNARAEAFYEALGYSSGEHVLYRRLEVGPGPPQSP